jgi:hypothetical protein
LSSRKVLCPAPGRGFQLVVSRQEVLGRNKNIEIGGLNVEQAVKVPTKLSKTVKLKKVKVRRGGKTVLGKK